MASTQKKKASDAVYYEKNKERIAGRHAEYYARKKTDISAQKAAYYQKNKKHIKAYQEKSQSLITAYREKNKAHIAARKIKYNEMNKEHFVAWRSKYYQALRNQFYDLYGLKKEGHEHGVCTCCKEADLVMFGTMSHIDGSGAQHREATGSPFKILKEALAVYNPSRFAAECFNCNCAAARHGGICPHKEKKKGLVPAPKLRIDDYF